MVQDPAQKQDLSVRMPRVHDRLKSKLQRLASDALQEAFDWSSSEPGPGESEETKTRALRLKSSFPSPFDTILDASGDPE